MTPLDSGRASSSPPHFFVESLAEEAVALSPEDSRHALRSLRLRPGDHLTLADDDGLWCRARLTGEKGGRAVVEVVGLSSVPRPAPQIWVAMAPPKGDRLWWAVQKLGEIGVDGLHLLLTKRTVRTPDAEGARRISQRMCAVARAAARQSRRPFVMHTGQFRHLAGALDQPGHLRVMLTGSAAAHLTAVLPAHPAFVEALTILVGPEGGFTDGELQHAEGAGASLASLGPGVLRTETAAIVSAALVLAHVGRLG